jgi:hypothetical protein
MLNLVQLQAGSTGNPKLDAIAQASALGIGLASVLVGIFGKKKTATRKPAKPAARKPLGAKVVITDEAVDELGARR